MTTKSKIFGTINKGKKKGATVEVVAESDVEYIILWPDGWRMKSFRELNLVDSYKFYREVEDHELCLFASLEIISFWTDTKLGELL